MSAWTFYDTATGEITRQFVGQEKLAKANLRQNEGCIRGHYRRSVWKVDLDSHEPVPRTPDT